MNWTPLGQVWKCERWAQCPTPLVLEDRARVYISERDEQNRSRVGYVDLDINDPTKVLDHASNILELGPVGSFDAKGQIPSYAWFGQGAELLYSGWVAPSGDVSYQNSIGRALSPDGKSFKRRYDGPIMDRTPREPYMAVTPCLSKDQVDMWYIAGLRWQAVNDVFEPIYVIRHASWNVSAWERYGEEVISQRSPTECFSRPWIYTYNNVRRMLFSYRDASDYRDGANAYRIGEAVLMDGKWIRVKGPEIARSEFDATMQAYAATFEAKGRLYMLWNGATFGKFGFGLAVAS